MKSTLPLMTQPLPTQVTMNKTMTNPMCQLLPRNTTKKKKIFAKKVILPKILLCKCMKKHTSNSICRKDVDNLSLRVLGGALMLQGGYLSKLIKAGKKKNPAEIQNTLYRIHQILTHTYSLMYNNNFNFQNVYATVSINMEKLGTTIQKIQKFVKQGSS